MEKKWNWKALLTIALAIIAILQLLPSFMRYTDAKGVERSHLPDAYTAVFDKTISYGLDLKGGLELRYTVDYKKAIGDNTFRLRDGLSDRLSEAFAKAKGKDWAAMTEAEKKAIQERFTITRTAFNALRIEFQDAADKKLLDELWASGAPPWKVW